MTSNPNDMIQQIQTKVMQIIEAVTGEAAFEMSAYEAEKSILTDLLKLGASYLTLFHNTRAAAYDVPEITTEAGQTLPRHSLKTRQQVTLFGDITIKRPYFYRKGEGGFLPSDQAVNLPQTTYSDCVQMIFSELAVGQAYQQGNAFMQRWLGVGLSTRAIQAMVLEHGCQGEAFAEQLPPPPSNENESILVAQADGKGVPMVISTETGQAVRMQRGQARSRKKEAIVTTVYTQAARPRTAEEVVASLFKTDEQDNSQCQESAPASPSHKMVWATLEGKETAMSRLQTAVAARDHAHITHKVALCDGAKPLQNRFLDKFPDFTLMLDFIHAYEYLWQAANILYTEKDPQRLVWVRQHTRQMLDSQTDRIITQIRHHAHQIQSPVKRKKLEQVAAYFERNLPHMDYASCLRIGLPIASGIIEGACRHIVKDRMELSGMRWTQQGAERLLQLRCVYQNDQWEAFWQYCRDKRQLAADHCEDYDDLPVAS